MQLADLSRLSDRLPQVLYVTVEEAQRINRLRVEQNVAFFRDNPDGINARINELAEEWDVDRVLQVVASAGTLAGVWLGLTRSRLWLLLPAAMAAGSLQYALAEQSPAADLARRLGFRTRTEIEAEMIALIALLEDAEGGSPAAQSG